MTAETSPSYISDLNANYPEANSAITGGDDNIRNIKTVLKTTFTGGASGLSGAVTASHTELNLLDTAVAGTIVNSKAVIYGSSGEVNATTLQIGGTAITSSAAELNLVDGSSAGSIVASKAVIYGANGENKGNTLIARGGLPGTDGANYNGFAFSTHAGSGLFSPGTKDVAIYTDSAQRLIIDENGLTYITGNQIGINNSQTPASAGATGTAGTICWDANYIYVCTATNTWKRAAIATWT